MCTGSFLIDIVAIAFPLIWSAMRLLLNERIAFMSPDQEKTEI